MKRVLTLTDDSFEFAPWNLTIVRRPTGGFLANGAKGVVGVFDQRGKYVRSVGRSGDGPGEFRRIDRIYFGSKDSVLVFDGALHRMTVYDPSFSMLVRTFGLPLFRDLLLYPGNRFLISGYFPRNESAGLSLHVVGAEGQALSSVGSEGASVRQQPDRMLGRSLVGMGAEGIYAAAMHQYRIERWSNDLRLLDVFVRTVDWFAPLRDEQFIDFPNRTRLPAQLIDIANVSNSQLLISSVALAPKNFVPDPKLVGRSGETPLTAMATGSQLNKYADTIFEIIEPGAATILTSLRVPGWYGLVEQGSTTSDGPFYWTFRAMPDGTDVIDIYSVQVVR